jgi:hypothetical protein
MTPARLRKYQSALLADLVTTAAEHRAHGLDEDAEIILRMYDTLAARFLTAPLRISHTRRMRVPLPPTLRVVDGGE